MKPQPLGRVVRPMRLLQSGGRDLIHAVRSLAKARAFTFVCVASLGVGMGTVIAILMLVRAIVGTPPLVNPDGLVELLVRPHGPLQAQTAATSSPGRIRTSSTCPQAETGMALTAWTFGETVLRAGRLRRAAARGGDVRLAATTSRRSARAGARRGIRRLRLRRRRRRRWSSWITTSGRIASAPAPTSSAPRSR